MNAVSLASIAGADLPGRVRSAWPAAFSHNNGEWEMDLGLKGRVAIVAASSQGLGRAVALGLAREGAKLAICSRGESKINKAAEDIRRETGVDILARAVDVTAYEQVRRFVAETQERFGRVDICVTNAGGPPAKPFSETSVEDWQAGVNLNLMSTLYFVREVLPLMQKRKWGRLITITSSSVKQPIDGLVLSNSVRSAVSGLAKTLANEYGKDNILVTNVCPGYTLTSRLDELSGRLAKAEGVDPGEIQQRWARQVPLGRLGSPEEFANMVVFLASERASYITGVSIAVDGGFVKGVY
ncbi:MAG TPA: SDR family oxidoreductase [Terriglobia bacterium]|nr:SDR family oxidoreductase [Terriglobia bacterium]